MNSSATGIALISPFLTLFFAIAYAVSMKTSSGDWFGLGKWMVVGIGLLLGSLVSLIASICAIKRKEKKALWSLLVSIPAGALLIIFSFFVLFGRPN